MLAVERQRLHVGMHGVDALLDDRGALEQRLLHPVLAQHVDVRQGLPRVEQERGLVQGVRIVRPDLAQKHVLYVVHEEAVERAMTPVKEGSMRIR